jgi:hypothetical protein
VPRPLVERPRPVARFDRRDVVRAASAREALRRPVARAARLTAATAAARLAIRRARDAADVLPRFSARSSRRDARCPAARALAASRPTSLLKSLRCPRAVVSSYVNAKFASSNFRNHSSHAILRSFPAPGRPGKSIRMVPVRLPRAAETTSAGQPPRFSAQPRMVS